MRPSKLIQLLITPNIGVKRWIGLLIMGVGLTATGITIGVLRFLDAETVESVINQTTPVTFFIVIIPGLLMIGIALLRLSRNLLAPYRLRQQGSVVDTVVEYSKRQRGFKFVAIGGGTGLPASLRGIKHYTGNITAIVTVADDGGSSGRLRRDLGVPPPGDLRNNIAALAKDDSVLTQLFQYRFQSGDLEGHSFGNLFIAALASIVGEKGDKNNLAKALVEVERVLNIRGRVLPATLDDVHLSADMRLTGSSRTITVRGESSIGEIDGKLERVRLIPADVEAYSESVQAIREADIIVIGPGSLYTSIIPNLMVRGIGDALKQTSAYKIYVCNVATQPVETEDYTVADHVVALENHIGRGIFQAVIANNAYPEHNRGENTRYVMPAPENHDVLQRYVVHYTDLTDVERPWRHDHQKLTNAIMKLTGQKS